MGPILRVGLMVLSLAATAMAQALAQRLGPEITPFRATAAFAPAQVTAFGIAPAQHRDHRWTGVAIGAGVLGVTGAVLRATACGRDDSATRDSCVGPTMVWGLMGATVGAVIGGLIGSTIRR